jgi:hypothetical protein
MCRLDAFIFFKKWDFCLSTIQHNKPINQLTLHAAPTCLGETHQSEDGSFSEGGSLKGEGGDLSINLATC